MKACTSEKILGANLNWNVADILGGNRTRDHRRN